MIHDAHAEYLCDLYKEIFNYELPFWLIKRELNFQQYRDLVESLEKIKYYMDSNKYNYNEGKRY